MGGGDEYCQAPNMLERRCRSETARPAAVSAVTAGQPLMVHEVLLSLVKVR